jgi:hypothetical protein
MLGVHSAAHQQAPTAEQGLSRCAEHTSNASTRQCLNASIRHQRTSRLTTIIIIMLPIKSNDHNSTYQRG